MRFRIVVVFFICFLVFSMTPLSAVLVGESQGNSPLIGSIDVAQDEMDYSSFYVDGMDSDLDKLESYTDSIDRNMDYAKKRFGDFGWKFWKWPEITLDLIKTLTCIISFSNNCENVANSLIDKSTKVKSNLANNEKGCSYINNVKSSFCNKDANFMAKKLSKKLNTTFTVKKVSARDLREGDIVQYLSEKKYPRYLVVQKIIETQNSTERQLLGNTPVNVPIGYLQSTGDKIVSVPLIGECIQLKPQYNTINIYNTLINTVEIQRNNIKDTDKKVKKY